MSFKIVQTEEPGRDNLSLTIVPEAWEENGILFWPKTRNAASAVRDPSSKPEKEWKQYPCIRKRDKFLSYKSAEEEMSAMLQYIDSDMDYSMNFPRKKGATEENLNHLAEKMEKRNNKQNVYYKNDINRNVIKILDVEVIKQCGSKNAEQDTPITTFCSAKNENMFPEVFSENVSSPETFEDFNNLQFADSSSIDHIKENQKAILDALKVLTDNQEKIMKELSQHRTRTSFLFFIFLKLRRDLLL